VAILPKPNQAPFLDDIRMEIAAIDNGRVGHRSPQQVL